MKNTAYPAKARNLPCKQTWPRMNTLQPCPPIRRPPINGGTCSGLTSS